MQRSRDGWTTGFVKKAQVCGGTGGGRKDSQQQQKKKQTIKDGSLC